MQGDHTTCTDVLNPKIATLALSPTRNLKKKNLAKNSDHAEICLSMLADFTTWFCSNTILSSHTLILIMETWVQTSQIADVCMKD